MNKYLVEFLGTLFFIYTIITTNNAVAIGLALMLVILLGGQISGGNFNPAVSIIMATMGKLPTHELMPYIVAQIAGGLVALELYKRV